MPGPVLPKLTITYLSVSLVYLAVFFAYYPTTQVLLERWLKLDEALSHGLLVVAMSIHLVTKSLARQNIGSSEKPSRMLPTLSLFIGSGSWLVLNAAGINILEQLLMPLIVLSALATLTGLKLGLKLILPVSFLFFAIPIWDYFNHILVELSSIAVTQAIELVGIAALIESNTITLPYGTLIIADGCSGLRYFTIALALASYVILDSKRNIKLSFQIVFAATALSLFSNWLRIFLITLIAYETDMESSLVEDHETFGWIIFCIVLAPIFFIARLFKLPDPIKEPSKQNWNTRVCVLTIVGLVAGPVIASSLAGSLVKPNINKVETKSFIHIGRPKGFPLLPQSKLLLQKRASSYLHEIHLYRIGNWRESNEDSLVPYWPSPFSHEIWNAINLNPIQSSQLVFKFVQLTHKLRNITVCLSYQYEVGGYSAISYRKAKLLQVPANLIGQNYYEARLAVAKPKTISCEQLRSEFEVALLEMAPSIFVEKQPPNSLEGN